MSVRIQVRRGTTSEWNTADPILNEGEIGYNTTLAAFKVGDGTTAWSELDYYQTAASITPAEVGAIALTEKGAANGVAELDANQNVKTLTSVIFEGATDNEFETTLLVTDPTADRTLTLPNITGTLITSGDTGTVTNTMLAGSIANEKLTNSSITINGSSVSLGGSISLPGDIEGVSAGTGLTGGGTSGTVTLSLDTTIAATISGTQTLTNKTLGSGTALSADLSAATYKITGLGAPLNASDAATKAYVDAVAEGLHVHASVVAASTSNVVLPTAPATLDGVSLSLNDRVLLKNQSTTSENGIYVVINGDLARAADYNTAAEIDPGDFVFVSGGTVNDNTGWVQTQTVTTLGTDPISFTQFSGAGTYLPGNGLTLTGNTFSINTGTTVDLSTAQTLSNKTLSSPTITGLFLNDSSIVFEGSSADEFETTLTVTNPTADRTITLPNKTGTVALEGYLVANLTWGEVKNGKSA